MMRGSSTTAERGFDDALVMDTFVRSRGEDVSALRAQAESRAGWLLAEGERPVCAAIGCGARGKFWKRSGRPVFEGQWACSKACAAKVVEASVRRHVTRHAAAATQGTHRHRVPLGLVLLDQGLLTQFQLRQALDAQRIAGHGRIGDWLGEICGVSSDKITRALAAQWNRPVLSGVGFVAEQMALVMPERLRASLRMLPVRVAAGKILYVAFEEEVDAAAVAALERMTGLQVESGLMSRDEFAQAAARLQCATPVRCKEETVADMTELEQRVAHALWAGQAVASRLTFVRGAWWLRMWLEPGTIGKSAFLPATGEDVVDVLYRRA